MSALADLFLNLDYPRVQQEPIRTLSTVRINPRVESVLINNHSIRDIGLLANYKHIRTVSLIHLRLDTTLSELLSFLGDADKFPVLREVNIENVVFQARGGEQQSLKECSPTRLSSLSASARQRYSHIRKLVISGVFIPGKAPIQAFITMASSALNALTLCELRLDLQSQTNDSDATHNDFAHIVGLLIAFPNLQTYNETQVTDQLQNLSRSRAAELLLSMRSRLQDTKDLLEETTLQLSKKGELIRSLKDTLTETKREKDHLEEEVLSLSATCATLKSSNLRLSQSNDLLDYLGASAQAACSTYPLESSEVSAPVELVDSSSLQPPTQQRLQQHYPSVPAMTQTDSESLIPSVSRAIAAHPSRPTLPLHESLHTLTKTLLEQSSDDSLSTLKFLSESIALAKAELQCNRIGMVTEDLYSRFNQKIRQKNDEIKILVDALVQVRNEEEKPKHHDKVELARARKTISSLNEEIEQLRSTVGVAQEDLQEVIVERDDLATNLSKLKKELAVIIENHQNELTALRTAAMAETEAAINSRMMEANAHIRLLEDNIVSMTDQIKLQEAELAVAEEGYCRKCMRASLTRFGVSNPVRDETRTSSCAATQTDEAMYIAHMSAACQCNVDTTTMAVQTMHTLAIDSLYSFELGCQKEMAEVAAKRSVMCQASGAVSDGGSGPMHSQRYLFRDALQTTECTVQTDVHPEIGPLDLINSVLQAPKLEEALQEKKQQCSELKARCDSQENELKNLLRENQKLKEYNQKLFADCKKLTTELSRQKIKSHSPRASSTLEIDNCDVEKTKLLLDLNKALQQRDAYKQNLKKAVAYVTKLMSLRAHDAEAIIRGGRKYHPLGESSGGAEEHNLYEQRISKLQHQVRQLAKHKAEQTRDVEAVIGKQDMIKHHKLYPRRAKSEYVAVCSPTMSQELIDSLEELAKRVDAMLPEKRGGRV